MQLNSPLLASALLVDDSSRPTALRMLSHVASSQAGNGIESGTGLAYSSVDDALQFLSIEKCTAASAGVVCVQCLIASMLIHNFTDAVQL